MLFYDIVSLLLTIAREDGALQFFSESRRLYLKAVIWPWGGIYGRDCGPQPAGRRLAL